MKKMCLVFFLAVIAIFMQKFVYAKDCGLDFSCGFYVLQWGENQHGIEKDPDCKKLNDNQYRFEKLTVDSIKLEEVMLGFSKDSFDDVYAIMQEDQVEDFKKILIDKIGQPMKKNKDYIWKISRINKKIALIFKEFDKKWSFIIYNEI